MDESVHADKEAAHVARQLPATNLPHSLARSGTDILLAVLGAHGIGGIVSLPGQEEVSRHRADDGEHRRIAAPLIVLAQPAQHPPVARELLLVDDVREDGAHVASLVQMRRQATQDLFQVRRCGVQRLCIERQAQDGASLGVARPLAALLHGEEHVVWLVFLLAQSLHIQTQAHIQRPLHQLSVKRYRLQSASPHPQGCQYGKHEGEVSFHSKFSIICPQI